jgi:hypothetical protein
MSHTTKLIARQAFIIALAITAAGLATTIYDLHNVCHVGYIRAAMLLLLCNTDGFTY